MDETGTTIDPATDSANRLTRAAELADYLRQNPKEAKRDPDLLGAQFGLSATMVSQIKSNVNSRATEKSKKDRKSVVDRLRTIYRRLAGLAEIAVSKPLPFQIVAAAITGAVSLSHLVTIAAFTWCGLEVWCLLLNPRFRSVIFGSILQWPVSAGMFYQRMQGEKLPTPFPPVFIALLFGFAMFILNLLLGGMLVVVGGSIQIAAQRRRSAALSRQDLVMRMFDLQQQLASLPVHTPKPMHPWIVFARQKPLLTASIIVFVMASLQHGTAIIFHVDPYALERAQELQEAAHSNQKIVVVAPNIGSTGFIVVTGLLQLVSFFFRLGLGFVAGSWRKVWLTVAGTLIGYLLAALWAFPVGGLGTVPLPMAIGVPLQEWFSTMLLILLVRFSVGFNRALTVYRAGATPDEAMIVGELIDIRHRLSAHPATICVLVVDAAGSTAMKKLADQLTVEYSFGRYQNWIDQIVKANGGKVEIRTGDGAICAFGSAEPAFTAAQQIQSDVRRFNETENKLDRPFRLRVALHAGLVHAELDKVQFTEVIDVAAHTEKHSPIGGIALTQSFVEALPSPPILPVTAHVDGFDIRAMSA